MDAPKSSDIGLAPTNKPSVVPGKVDDGTFIAMLVAKGPEAIESTLATDSEGESPQKLAATAYFPQPKYLPAPSSYPPLDGMRTSLEVSNGIDGSLRLLEKTRFWLSLRPRINALAEKNQGEGGAIGRLVELPGDP